MQSEGANLVQILTPHWTPVSLSNSQIAIEGEMGRWCSPELPFHECISHWKEHLSAQYFHQSIIVCYHMNYGTFRTEQKDVLGKFGFTINLKTLKHIWIFFLICLLPAFFLGSLQHFGLLYHIFGYFLWINSSHTWIR